MKKYHPILLIFMILIWLPARPADSQEKMRIAVLDFKGKGVSATITGAVSDIVKSDMVNAGYFAVIERQQISEILKEQGFQQSGCTDQACAIEIGKLLTAKKILIGEVTKVGSTIIITARVVDVKNGVAEYSAKEAAQSEDALFAAVSRLTKNLVNNMTGVENIQQRSDSFSTDKKELVPPEITASQRQFTDKVKIEWKETPDAAKYYIYRSTAGFDEYSEIGVTETASFEDKTAEPGTGYSYYIKSWSIDGYSSSSDPAYGFLELAAPEVTVSRGTFTDKIILEWKSIPGAEKYFIYRSLSENDNFLEIDDTPNLSYQETDLTPGKTYYYQVLAWASTGYGAKSRKESGFVKLSPPARVEASDDHDNSIDISWAKTRGAEKYYLYRTETEGGKFTMIKEIEETTFSDTEAQKGAKSYYMVKAVAPAGESEFSSSCSGHRLSEKEASARDAKRGYYARSLVPGWGQFYAGETMKGYIYSGIFFTTCAMSAYAIVNFYNAKSDYEDMPRRLSDTKTKKLRDDYSNAALFANISLGLIAASYIANWVDILFFNSPDFMNDFSAFDSKKTDTNFTLLGFSYNRGDTILNISSGIRF